MQNTNAVQNPEQFVSATSIVVFALGCFVITYVIRTIVEGTWGYYRGQGSWKRNTLYNEVLLHLLPIAVGFLLAIAIKSMPWPWPISLSRGLKWISGSFLGMTCGLFYGRVRGLLQAQQNAQGQGSSPLGAGSPDLISGAPPPPKAG